MDVIDLPLPIEGRQGEGKRKKDDGPYAQHKLDLLCRVSLEANTIKSVFTEVVCPGTKFEKKK